MIYIFFGCFKVANIFHSLATVVVANGRYCQNALHRSNLQPQRQMCVRLLLRRECKSKSAYNLWHIQKVPANLYAT